MRRIKSRVADRKRLDALLPATHTGWGLRRQGAGVMTDEQSATRRTKE
jgi:hypothetical protein